MRYSGAAVHLAQPSLAAPFLSHLSIYSLLGWPSNVSGECLQNYPPFPDYSIWPARVLNAQLLGRVL
jgi:hypothetical protein